MLWKLVPSDFNSSLDYTWQKSDIKAEIEKLSEMELFLLYTCLALRC